jgi:crotonobetainyl-CoA:carnitine CoA-transferase CaiB-like acyl-CoA transferase
MTLPLAGIRVLDLTTSLAGPYCTLILGTLGAEVVKIERPGAGDDTRAWGPPFWDGESPTFLSMNAGKRSVALDLKSDDGQAAIRGLAAEADVFVQNLRPGRAEALGLGFDDVAALNARVVYCSIGAFGEVGPLSDRPGYDPLMQAAGGIMSITGEAGRPAVRAGVSLVDQGTGMWAVIGILAALRRRDEEGTAQRVTTSLYETALNWLPYQIASYLASGEEPGPVGTGVAMIAPYEVFEAADGRVMIAAANDKLYAALCTAIGLDEDPRFASNPQRVAARAELAALVAARVAGLTSAELLERLAGAGVPAAPVRGLAAVVADEQTQALEILQEVPHPTVRDLRLVAPPLSLNGERLGYAAAPPLLGEHTDAVLARGAA